MALYPVIMCGGSGTRLWPASRPSRPKQFIALTGEISLFQDTVTRVADLAGRDGRIVVVAGIAHRTWIADQLAELNTEADVLLEPEARDSAAAMAAAAAWVRARDPGGIIAFVASDHHIPDADAFRRAVKETLEAARGGRIVTLGVKPHEPSSAYGYIRPGSRGLSDVEAFVEKPTTAIAAEYIDAGYLWNSGNFIASADTLIEELTAHAPAIVQAVEASLPPPSPGHVHPLSAAFAEAPKISIDYAVMERTRKASVLEVDFAWSDLGSWKAIADAARPDRADHVFEDAEGCFVRSPTGVAVAAVGVHNLAIVVDTDAVLVCDLDRAQDVKRVVDRLRASSPDHVDVARDRPEDLTAGVARFADWMRLRALPMWATLGLDEDGGFREAITLDGRPVDAHRRARVQARQIYVYAQAGILGWRGPWRGIVERGLDKLFSAYIRPDGLCRTLLDMDGSPLDETAMLYDQAFVLFALAKAREAGCGDEALDRRAQAIRDRLIARALPNGALEEAGDHPYQSNAHMHFFEAALAWEALDDQPEWRNLCDGLAELAMTTFIDPKGGFLREFFDADWRPAEGEDGKLVEPGHQFEWAWLLARYGARRGSERALLAAEKLHAAGRRGIAAGPVVALDAMNDDLCPRTDRARLWPQTEWLKSSLILAESGPEEDRPSYLEDAAQALRALRLYLTPDGLWRDKMMAGGRFVDEPAPASSLYHIMAALQQTGATLGQTSQIEHR